jgi:hypothetical protein
MPPKRTMWGMHRLLLAAALVFVAALRASTAGPPTMRVDYYHTGKTIGRIGRPPQPARCWSRREDVLVNGAAETIATLDTSLATRRRHSLTCRAGRRETQRSVWRWPL